MNDLFNHHSIPPIDIRTLNEGEEIIVRYDRHGRLHSMRKRRSTAKPAQFAGAILWVIFLATTAYILAHHYGLAL